MVQIIPAAPQKQSFSSQLGLNLGSGIGSGVGQGVQQHYKNKFEKEAQEAQFQRDLQKLHFQKELEKELQKEKYGYEKELQGSKSQDKVNLLKQLGLFGDNSQEITPESSGNRLSNQELSSESSNSLSNQLAPDQIAAISLLHPELGKVLQDQIKGSEKKFVGDRSYHSDYAKKAEESATQLRESIPKKEMALNYARNAVETANLGYFSPDKLADVTGMDLFRTAKGAQLVTAGKENLLSNMGRVSARAQNIWFEQRLNSMFPKIGQSKEANLTVQEMLEGEVALDKAYLDEFDRLTQSDESKYGYVKKDISKRAHDASKPLEKEILSRTTYRMKEIEEVEKGLTALKKEVGKNVVQGTPLTLQMAKLYKEKFGDNALAVAKKNGYHIPTLEEFQNYRLTPQQSRSLE
jgi:hypothetical protein